MTPVDLCNIALADLGHDRVITSFDPAVDRSKEAARCALAWPRARRHVAGSFTWSFLTVDMPAAALPDAAAAAILTPGYAYAYAAPADALRISAVLDADGEKVAFILRNSALQTTDPATRVIYTIDSEDIDAWPQPFTDAVCAAISARLARPITADTKIIARTASEYADALRSARRHDQTAFSSTPGTRSPYKDARS